MDELCHNEMSRDHDAPLEYLRILASLKLRFGLAALATAHGALPVCSPMVALDTQLPNGYVGRRAFPMEAEGRLADFDRRIHPRQSKGCFVSLIGLAIHPPSRPRPFHSFGILRDDLSTAGYAALRILQTPIRSNTGDDIRDADPSSVFGCQ